MISVDERFLKEVQRDMEEKKKIAKIEKMEEGENLNELNTDQAIQTEIIIHAGKKWKVTYRKIGWYLRKEITSMATSIDRGNKAHFDLAKYTRQCLIKMNVAINEQVLNEMDYLKLDEGVGKQLDELVESPQEIISEGESDFTVASSGAG